MDLTFQVPLQYCSLQHRTLLPSPVTSTAGWCFCFGSISSFFLELFLQWSPGAYWAPTDLWSYLSMSYLFAFSYCSWGSQGKNTELVCHSLLQWTTFCQNSPLKWVYLSFSPLCLASLLFTAICKASSDNHFAILHFFFLDMVLITASCTMSRTSVHSSSGTLSDLVLWIYLSLPLFNHKGFDLGHTWIF